MFTILTHTQSLEFNSLLMYISKMENQSVEDFYNTQGWEKIGEDTHDALINENLTEVAASYVTKVRNRIFQNLGSGEFLLDVGCGPIQYPEYVQYSKNFKYRVCVDLSSKALGLAEKRIGKHGIFVLGDYLSLGLLKEAPFDGATLINVLYHVEKERQERLVRKILNDLKPGAKLVIVYSNPRTFSAVITRFLVSVKRKFNFILRGSSGIKSRNPIYFYRFPFSFWNRFENEATIEVKAWRTFSPA